MSIDERVHDRWPQVEADLQQALGVIDYLNARDRARDLAISLLYAPRPAPDAGTITNIILEQEIADRVVLALMPMAHEHYMHGMLGERIEAGMGGAGSTELYDKVKVLNGVREQIERDQAARAVIVQHLVQGTTESTLAYRPLLVRANPRTL